MSNFNQHLSPQELIQLADIEAQPAQQQQRRKRRRRNFIDEASEQAQEATTEWKYISRKDVFKRLRERNPDIVVRNCEELSDSSCDEQDLPHANDCVGCDWAPSSNFNKDSKQKKGIPIIDTAIRTLYGSMSTARLAKVVHKIFVHQIRDPLRSSGQEVPHWTKRSIYNHIKKHTNDPCITLNERRLDTEDSIEMVKECQWKCSKEDEEVFWADKAMFDLEASLTNQLLKILNTDSKKLHWQRTDSTGVTLQQTLNNLALKLS
jgi:hypothetical protein